MERVKIAVRVVFLLVIALLTAVLGLFVVLVWLAALPWILVERLYHWAFPERISDV